LSTYRDMGTSTVVPIGAHFYSAEAYRFRGPRFGGGRPGAPERRRAAFLHMGRYVLTSTPGGRDELRRVVDPELAELVDELQPQEVPSAWLVTPEWTTAGAEVAGSAVFFRIDDPNGHLAGFGLLSKPAAGMSHLGLLAAVADVAHLER